MDKKIEKLKFEDMFIKELSHLGFNTDHKVFWHNNNNDTLPLARIKKTLKKDISYAKFSERLDLTRSIREPKDKLNKLATLLNLKGIDIVTLVTIYDTVR